MRRARLAVAFGVGATIGLYADWALWRFITRAYRTV